MSNYSGQPGAALVRAAASEAARLDRIAARLALRRQALLGQCAQLDEELRGVRQRRALLEEIAGIPRADQPARPPSQSAPQTLRGIELRAAAGRLLWQHQQDDEIHYSEWFERMLAAGYAVSGRDPLASFLTNIRSCPAVKRGSRPGHYRLDRGALRRAAGQLEAARAQLEHAEQTLARAFEISSPPTERAALRARYARSKRHLGRLERQDRELRHIFTAPPATQVPPTRHVGRRG